MSDGDTVALEAWFDYSNMPNSYRLCWDSIKDEIYQLRSALEADEEHAKDILAESRILREALERIAEGKVGATMGGIDGELLRLSRQVARDALLRAGKGTLTPIGNGVWSGTPVKESCETCRWADDETADECSQCAMADRQTYWTPAASGEGE